MTGPLTNLALALRCEPGLPRLLRGLVIMGGKFAHRGNTVPAAEWNFSVDPHAAREVFRACHGLPGDKLPVVCGLEVTERVEMGPGHLRRLGEAAGAGPELVLPDQPAGQRSSSRNPLVACLSDAIRFSLEFHRRHGQGYVAPMHDAFAACVAVGRTPFHSRPAAVDVETESPMPAGTATADFHGLRGLPANARIVSGNDPGHCLQELVSSVGALARRLDVG